MTSDSKAKTDLVAAEMAPPDPFLNMLEKIAANPDIDADKIDKFLSMQERILDRNARNAFYDAMNQVQANLPAVARDAENRQTRSMYARLETISRAIKPVYTRFGFSTSFWEGVPAREGFIRIEGRLRHRDGHSEEYHCDLPIDDKGIQGNVNKTAMHGTGSTFTYGRRYLTCMIFDIAVGDDTDGNLPEDESLVTPEQAANIEALLTEVGADRAKFLKWCQADSVDEILSRQYSRCLKELEARRVNP